MSKINIFALGGLNEVGKNMYVVKVDEEIYIFDAGMKFNVENAYGVDYILPDYHYLKENENEQKNLIFNSRKFFFCSEPRLCWPKNTYRLNE